MRSLVPFCSPSPNVILELSFEIPMESKDITNEGVIIERLYISKILF